MHSNTIEMNEYRYFTECAPLSLIDLMSAESFWSVDRESEGEMTSSTSSFAACLISSSIY